LYHLIINRISDLYSDNLKNDWWFCWLFDAIQKILESLIFDWWIIDSDATIDCLNKIADYLSIDFVPLQFLQLHTITYNYIEFISTIWCIPLDSNWLTRYSNCRAWLVQ
jgi:hypothetical protein